MTIYADQLSYHLTNNLADIEHAWTRLSAANHLSLHQSAPWCLTYAKAIGVQLVFLVGALGDDVKLLIPLTLQDCRSARILQVPGADFSNCNTVLADADLLPARDENALAHLRKKLVDAIAPQADILILKNVPLQWRGNLSVFSGLESVQNQNSAYQLPLLETFELTLRQINAKRRRKKFRISTEIAAELGGYVYKIADGPKKREFLLQTFFQQKAERFAIQGLPNPFERPNIPAFFHALTAVDHASSNNTILELHYLELQGQHEGLVAAVTGISRKGDHTICQFGSIDSGFAAKISPGELLFYHVIEREQSIGTKLFDFGIGDQRYKRSWCPVETAHHDIYLGATVKGKLLANSLVLLTKTKRWIKDNPKLYAFVQKLRRSNSQRSEEA